MRTIGLGCHQALYLRRLLLRGRETSINHRTVFEIYPKKLRRAFGSWKEPKELKTLKAPKTPIQGQLGAVRPSKTPIQGQLGAARATKTPIQGQLGAIRPCKTPIQGQLGIVKLPKLLIQSQLGASKQRARANKSFGST